jgi:hypothetical protein
MRFLLNNALIDTEDLEGVVHIFVREDRVGVVKKKKDDPLYLYLYVCKPMADPPMWGDYAQFRAESEEQARVLFHEQCGAY